MAHEPTPDEPWIEPWGPPPYPGGGLLRATWVVTGVLALATLAALPVVGPLRYLHAGLSLVLFLGGCAAFFRAYWVAVQRSRECEIGIGGLFFLAGDTAPAPVRRSMNAALAAQVVVSLAGSALQPFSSLAFGVLVPMAGLGLNGLWGSAHGHFAARAVEPRRARARAAPAARDGRTEAEEPGEPQPDGNMGKNGRHG
jgi:hypothetical protein